MTTAHPDQVVELIGADRAQHYFDDRGPLYSLAHGSNSFREILVDPAPAYAHDIALARLEFERLRTVAPLPFPLALFLLGLEVKSRTNGTYYDNCNYSGEQLEIGGVKQAQCEADSTTMANLRRLGARGGEGREPRFDSARSLRLTVCGARPSRSLGDISTTDVYREGFPTMTQRDFVEMFKSHNGGLRDQVVTRIEFEYV